MPQYGHKKNSGIEKCHDFIYIAWKKWSVMGDQEWGVSQWQGLKTKKKKNESLIFNY